MRFPSSAMLAALALAGLLTPGAVDAAGEARFIERDGVLYVSDAPEASAWADSGNVQYDALINEVAERYLVPVRLVAAVIRAESNFNARAVSPKGARGLMQLMPATAARLGVRDAFDPRENVDGGVRHLRGLIDQYAGDVRLAVAAYNAGSEPVDRARGVPNYPETQTYVARVLALFGGQTSVPSAPPAPTVTSTASSRQPGPSVQASGGRAFHYVAADGTAVYTNVPKEALPLTTRDQLARPAAKPAVALASRQ